MELHQAAATSIEKKKKKNAYMLYFDDIVYDISSSVQQWELDGKDFYPGSKAHPLGSKSSLNYYI